VVGFGDDTGSKRLKIDEILDTKDGRWEILDLSEINF
jgi:hypothetical protein